MTPDFIQLHHGDDQALAAEAAAGLRAPAAHVSPKFFYDALGSRLFDAITETAEYYPTRTEAAIVATHAACPICSQNNASAGKSQVTPTSRTVRYPISRKTAIRFAWMSGS